MSTVPTCWESVAGGHRVYEFDWSGRLGDDGRLWFDLTLTTADYDEDDVAGDDDGDLGDVPSWQAPIVWNNYHRCTISSTSLGDAAGLLAATPGRPFPLTDGAPRTLTADSLPLEDPDAAPAFSVYLLGHDSVADHAVTFTADGDGGHSIDWTGRAALTYVGDEVFRYGFRAEIRGARLARVVAPGDARERVADLLNVSEDQAVALLLG